MGLGDAMGFKSVGLSKCFSVIPQEMPFVFVLTCDLLGTSVCKTMVHSDCTQKPKIKECCV